MEDRARTSPVTCPWSITTGKVNIKDSIGNDKKYMHLLTCLIANATLRDLKNFIGDRSSNVSQEQTIQRCSRGLHSLANVRRQFGEDEYSSGGQHRRPDDTKQDVRLAAKSLTEDLFVDVGRTTHPLTKKTPVFGKMGPRQLKNFSTYVEQVAGVKVVQTTSSPRVLEQYMCP